MPRALSVGLGGAGAHLALLGAAVGSQAGGSRQLQAPSRCWEAQGGKFSSSANRGLSQKHRQPLQGQGCREAQCPFAELEGSKLLQGACHLEAPSRLFGGSAPTVPHTCLCNSETLLELFGEPW